MNRIDSVSSSVQAGSPRSVKLGPARSIPPEICECCFSDLIQPIDAETNPAGTVRMTLRCPECHNVRVGECSWDEAREFGRHFAKGKAELRATYSEISQDNLRDELECLVAALQAGLIGPDDFLPFRYSG